MVQRKCFVIMPFSATVSTTAKNWTRIYENIIRPAIEDSEFDFVCKRAKATRGNIIKEIVTDLSDSDLVIADLTDHNPNVCYELGIRHGLKVGTILLAQDRKFLKIFDLHNYASHVYKWRTDKQKENLIKKIRELLIEFLDNPLKPDNPPQDFLQHKPTLVAAPSEQIKDILEYDSQNKPIIVLPKKHLSKKLAVGLILLGNAGNGLSMNELVKQVSKNWKRVRSTDLSPLLSHSSGWFFSEGTRGNYLYSLSTKGRKEIMAMIDLLKKK